MSQLTHPLQGPAPSVFGKATLSRDEILALDRLAAAAWAAPEEINCHGWLMRFADGITRRANSTAPFPIEGGVALDAQIAATEAFYRERALPPRFQISPAAAPEDLDEVLARRGYETEAPVDIMIADAEKLAGDTGSAVSISDSAPGGWWELYMEGYGRDPRAIVAGARDVALFASASGDGGAIEAIGLGVLSGDWLAVFGMFTRPECRRRGLGAGLIRALAAFAVDRGGIGVYLQVEANNPNARRLYESLGFRGVYGYHYRTLWTAS
ncbi:MAG: GNAT family N-acetyltransferase [Rhodospirillales bacterium]|nr:GNAT family N-acetyltransferase [Rhodospirillales bacterium]